MKNLFVLFFCMFSMFLVSCSKDEAYSCDKEINSWVVSNLDKVETMTRSNWLDLPEDLKGPTFGAFSKEQKLIFWKTKLSSVLNLKWNNAERAHVHKLYLLIEEHPEWFDVENRTEEIDDEMYVSAYEWIDYAKIKLHWTVETIGAIVASGNELIDKTGRVRVNKLTYKQRVRTRGETGSEKSCNCNQKYDFCSGMEDKCGDSNCKEQPHCGWLLLSLCNGLCKIS